MTCISDDNPPTDCIPCVQADRACAQGFGDFEVRLTYLHRMRIGNRSQNNRASGIRRIRIGKRCGIGQKRTVLICYDIFHFGLVFHRDIACRSHSNRTEIENQPGICRIIGKERRTFHRLRSMSITTSCRQSHLETAAYKRHSARQLIFDHKAFCAAQRRARGQTISDFFAYRVPCLRINRFFGDCRRGNADFGSVRTGKIIDSAGTVAFSGVGSGITGGRIICSFSSGQTAGCKLSRIGNSHAESHICPEIGIIGHRHTFSGI